MHKCNKANECGYSNCLHAVPHKKDGACLYKCNIVGTKTSCDEIHEKKASEVKE